jgi:hypothetical protein
MNQFTKASRHRCRIKLALQGASGSGKTYSSLLLAYGLTGDWNKIAVIDTENGSSHLYSKLGPYSVLQLTPPFSPENYSEAIEMAVKEGFECLIIDSMSHEWNGSGGILDIHGAMPGNSFTNWAKVTPRHNRFMQTILQSDIHVIGTMRSKTDYVMNEKNGRSVPEKVGMKATQREDVEYEFTLVFELNQQHMAQVSKDRTGLFRSLPEVKLTSDIGMLINDWCTNAPEQIKSEPHDYFKTLIDDCKSMVELVNLYNNNEDRLKDYKDEFIRKKNELNTNLNYLNNGTHH